MKMRQKSVDKYQYLRNDENALSKSIDVHDVFIKKSIIRVFVSYLSYLFLIINIVLTLFAKEKLNVGSFWGLFASAIFAKCLQYKPVKKESVVIIPSSGIQLKTHYRSGREDKRFIRLDKILKILFLFSLIKGLLAYYDFPLTNTKPTSGVKYELNTLPVDLKSIADGDTVTVYVDATVPHESCRVPRDITKAAKERTKARAARNYQKAVALQKTIVAAGYRMVPSNGGELLAKKYRIRLRGIDSPESKMPYGQEAKEEMVKLVQDKKLKVFVYGDDRYGRSVGDIHSGKIFVQEHMLKKGLAWHYTAYDHREELAIWEKDARAARVGLWAQSNPEKPWEWRKEKRNGS